MYIRTRTIADGISMICKNCGHAIGVNKICDKPIQTATDMLKHMAVHNVSRAVAVAARVMEPEPKAIVTVEVLPPLAAIPWIASIPQSPN
jgi:hypothetical protein